MKKFILIILIFLTQTVVSQEGSILNTEIFPKILETVFNDTMFISFLDNIDNENKQEILFLENDYLKKENTTCKNCIIENKQHFIDNNIDDFLYVYDIIINKDLAKVVFTRKNSEVGIFYLTKSINKWYVEHYNYKKSLQLKKSPATLLYEHVQRINRSDDKRNSSKIKNGMSFEEVNDLLHYDLKVDNRNVLYRSSGSYSITDDFMVVIDTIKNKVVRVIPQEKKK